MIMLNMTLHFKLIYILKKINYGNPNNVYNYDFTCPLSKHCVTIITSIIIMSYVLLGLGQPS